MMRTLLAVLLLSFAILFGLPACASQPVLHTGALAAQPVVAFIGDSYTEGYLAAPGTRWTTVLAQRMGWDERNFGRGGTGYVTASSYGPPFRDMIDEAAATNPEIVVVQGGVNDYNSVNTEPRDVQRAITDTYRALRDRLPKAWIIAVGPTFTFYVTPALVAFDRAVADAATAVGARYVSLIDPPVITKDMMLPDNLHLDSVGHAAMAERVASSVRGR